MNFESGFDLNKAQRELTQIELSIGGASEDGAYEFPDDMSPEAVADFVDRLDRLVESCNMDDEQSQVLLDRATRLQKSLYSQYADDVAEIKAGQMRSNNLNPRLGVIQYRIQELKDAIDAGNASTEEVDEYKRLNDYEFFIQLQPGVDLTSGEAGLVTRMQPLLARVRAGMATEQEEKEYQGLEDRLYTKTLRLLTDRYERDMRDVDFKRHEALRDIGETIKNGGEFSIYDYRTFFRFIEYVEENLLAEKNDSRKQEKKKETDNSLSAEARALYEEFMSDYTLEKIIFDYMTARNREQKQVGVLSRRPGREAHQQMISQHESMRSVYERVKDGRASRDDKEELRRFIGDLKRKVGENKATGEEKALYEELKQV